MSFLGMDLFLWILLVEACVLSPILGVRQVRLLKHALDEGDTRARLRIYRRTMLMEWIFTAGILGAWLAMGRGWADIRLVARAEGWQWLAIALGLAATAMIAWMSHAASRDPKQLSKLRGELGSLENLIPHNEPELRRFGWLSLTAGICEEIRYRGIFMAALAAHVGLWPAVLLSSLIFGIGHSYQGLAGVLRTGLVGLVMALIVAFSGSLYVAILVHAILDLAQGHMLYRAVNFDEATPELNGGTA
jgi:uncharacterized protein